MRIGIEHTTGFSYAEPVRASFNQARMTPANTPQQTVWSARLSIDPSPWSYTSTDYYGNLVTTFELHEPHQRLTVRSDSVVDTHRPTDQDIAEPADSDLDFAALRSVRVVDEFAEFLEVSARTQPHPDLRQTVADLGQNSPRQAALEVNRLVHQRLKYQPGASQVTSTASEIWADGRGVCQDFSHVTVGALRSLGIPTRYVSGYLHPGASTPNVAVDGESHSWVEWWCGSWVAFDPTALSPVGDHHVRVGHGRDYGDVPPLRGTYAGGLSDMFVNVKLTQLG